MPISYTILRGAILPRSRETKLRKRGIDTASTDCHPPCLFLEPLLGDRSIKVPHRPPALQREGGFLPRGPGQFGDSLAPLGSGIGESF